MIRALLSEFVGTAMVIAGYAYFHSLPMILTVIVIAKALTLGQLNPAVTLWYYMSGKLDIMSAISYVVAQSLAVVTVIITKTDL